MIKFDPIEERQVLDDNVAGYIPFLLYRVDEVRANGGLAACAASYMNTAIRCILVGYDTPAERCLKRAHEWLNLAISENERPQGSEDDGGAEAERHHALALCNWLLHDQHDAENFGKYVENSERFLTITKLGRDQHNVSLTLPQYFGAGACKQALTRFTEAGFDAPTTLGTVQGEAQMAYALCRHRLGKGYKAEEVETALDKFLHRNVGRWLGDGVFLRAAEWMKIAHWTEGGPVSAREAVLKCYDYLPGVTRPEPVARRI